LQIRSAVWDAIVAHSRDEAPNECCGLLVGPAESPAAIIEESVRTRNLEASPTSYRVDPVEQIALNRRLRSTGCRVIGAYHSHPHTPAEPSATDVAEAFYPEFVYVIVSLATPDEPVVRGFRLAGGNIKAVPLVRVP
jgi:proteasome lid subunit RPN8/RPN11